MRSTHAHLGEHGGLNLLQERVVAGGLHILAALIAQHPDLPRARAPALFLFAIQPVPCSHPLGNCLVCAAGELRYIMPHASKQKQHSGSCNTTVKRLKIPCLSVLLTERRRECLSICCQEEQQAAACRCHAQATDWRTRRMSFSALSSLKRQVSSSANSLLILSAMSDICSFLSTCVHGSLVTNPDIGHKLRACRGFSACQRSMLTLLGAST